MLPQLSLSKADFTLAVRNPVPPTEAVLFRFQTEKELARWKVFTDQQYGGQTTARLDPSTAEPVLLDCSVLLIFVLSIVLAGPET